MQSKTPGILEGKLYEAKQPLIVSVQLLREARQGQKRRNNHSGVYEHFINLFPGPIFLPVANAWLNIWLYLVPDLVPHQSSIVANFGSKTADLQLNFLRRQDRLTTVHNDHTARPQV